MSIARQLYQLQEIDLKLESNERTQRQIVSQLGESQEVARIKTELAVEQQRLEELEHQQHSYEWEIDDLESKIKTNEEKLYSGKITNPKELSNLQLEVEDLKSRRAQFEDKALEIMDQVESTTARVATMSKELERLETEWQRHQQELSANLNQLKTEHADLKSQRQTQAVEIEPQLMETYSALRKQKGTAIAKVEQGMCRGCQIVLPTTELQQVRGGNIVRCDSCGRILFLA